jgi:hypothetical protein
MEGLFLPALCIGCFVAGVIFAKTVISEAASIKNHVTEEVGQLRLDVQEKLAAAAKKV